MHSNFTFNRKLRWLMHDPYTDNLLNLGMKLSGIVVIRVSQMSRIKISVLTLTISSESVDYRADKVVSFGI